MNTQKLCLLLFTVILFASCSNESQIENDEIQEVIDNNQIERGFLCGPNHHLEFQVFDELLIFKKSGCESGFGFCFGIKVSIEFECVANSPATVVRNSDVSYNSSSGLIKATAIANNTNKEITFYFHKDIVSSPDHLPSDFSTFDVEDGSYLSDKIRLTGGSYPLIVDGIFYKYKVPYVDEN